MDTTANRVPLFRTHPGRSTYGGLAFALLLGSVAWAPHLYAREYLGFHP